MRSTRYPSLPHDVDMDSLPPAVVRKYFSSLERLRLAEDGKTSSRPPSRLSICPSNDSARLTIHASHTFTIVTSSFVHTGQLLNRTRLRRRRNSAADITPKTTAWFAALPPAVQKKLFSREECSFYAQEQTTVILDAADETLYRRSWHPTEFAAFGHRASEDDTIVDSEDAEEAEEKVDSAIDMGDYSVDGFRWLEDDGDLDLKLDDYHQAIAETNRRTLSISTQPRRKTKRNPSLSSLSIRRGRSSTSSSQTPQIEAPPTPALPTRVPHSRSSSFSAKHLRSQASVSSIDPRATHYQDPAARMKLRLYLASPQKFDEAIEFGFPSARGRSPWTPTTTRPMTSPQPRPEVNRTFFHDDTPELSGDEEDDHEDHDTFYDPRTPDDPLFQMNRPLRKSSADGFAKARPFSVRKTTEPYPRGLPSEREMTLHMTLTRPDLRSPEDSQQRHDHQKVNKTPLEKAELPLEVNAVSIWDTLPPEESKVKRFLRRLKLK